MRARSNQHSADAPMQQKIRCRFCDAQQLGHNQTSAIVGAQVSGYSIMVVLDMHC